MISTLATPCPSIYQKVFSAPLIYVLHFVTELSWFKLTPQVEIPPPASFSLVQLAKVFPEDGHVCLQDRGCKIEFQCEILSEEAKLLSDSVTTLILCIIQ